MIRSARTDRSSAVVDLYERHAHVYDRERGRGLRERAWLDRFLAHVPTGGTVLDVGCGTGEPIARYLTGRGLAVVGVDASPSMIGLCRARFPDSDSGYGASDSPTAGPEPSRIEPSESHGTFWQN